MQSDTSPLIPLPDRGGEEKIAGPVTHRLPVQTVERLQRAIGGDARVEGMILRFIADRYGTKSLLYLPANVAQAALQRPADFVHAAKQHCEPELNF